MNKSTTTLPGHNLRVPIFAGVYPPLLAPFSFLVVTYCESLFLKRLLKDLKESILFYFSSVMLTAICAIFHWGSEGVEQGGADLPRNWMIGATKARIFVGIALGCVFFVPRVEPGMW